MGQLQYEQGYGQQFTILKKAIGIHNCDIKAAEYSEAKSEKNSSYSFSFELLLHFHDLV